jgi:hypothetical protein
VESGGGEGGWGRKARRIEKPLMAASVSRKMCAGICGGVVVKGEGQLLL